MAAVMRARHDSYDTTNLIIFVATAHAELITEIISLSGAPPDAGVRQNAWRIDNFIYADGRNLPRRQAPMPRSGRFRRFGATD